MGHLTLEQRYKIQALREIGKSLSEIGGQIGKDKSVISRELRRNGDRRNGAYKADLTNRKAQTRHKTKPKKKRLTAQVEANILYYLTMDFSPEQIKGKANLEGKAMVSIERIYQYIWADKKAGGKLHRYLRTKGKKYAKRG